MPVNNFELIRSLLEFRTEDDFYFLQILQRKKDHNNGKVNGTNNNSRLIKAYYIDSLEKFDFITPEVIEMCNLFGARANINMNRRSYEKMAFHTLQKMSEQLMHRDYKHIHTAFNTACGKHHAETDKLWLFDFDAGDEAYEETFMECMNGCRPDGDKLFAKIPSRSGFHLLTRPFDLMEFSKRMKEAGLNWSADGDFLHLHKNNPTNLFIP
jgi:hypothetical protein